MAVFSGGAIGPWIGGVVADHAGYRIPFALTGLLLFLAGLMVTVGISEPNFRVCAPSGGTSPTTLGGLLSRRSFDLLLAVIFLVSFSTMLVAPVLPLFVEHLMPARERVSSTVGLLMAVVGIAAGFGSVLMGRISDCFGSKLTLLVCTLSSGLGSVLQGFVSTVAQLFALRVGFGLVAGGTQPTVNTLVASSVPEDAFGKAYGLTSSANAIGMASGPMVGGLIASSMGLRAPFVVAGILLIAISGGIAFRLGVARKA
jgi:MFS family permease